MLEFELWFLCSQGEHILLRSISSEHTPPTTSIFKDQICDWIQTDWNFLENKGNKPKTQTEKLSAQRDVPREKIEGIFSLSFGKFVRSHQTSYKHGTCFCENFTESPAFFIFFRGDLTLQPVVALTLLCTYLRLVLNSGFPLEAWGYRQVFAILAWACWLLWEPFDKDTGKWRLGSGVRASQIEESKTLSWKLAS